MEPATRKSVGKGRVPGKASNFLREARRFPLRATIFFEQAL
jgi:hypothetical protein